jgi:hypothetical protein
MDHSIAVSSHTFQQQLFNKHPVSTQVVEDSDFTSSLQEHTQLNMTLCDEAFPDYIVDEASGSLRHSTSGRILISAKLDNHSFVYPALYRDNCAVKEISFDDLLAKLENYISV